jgi:hypothetical protein
VFPLIKLAKKLKVITCLERKLQDTKEFPLIKLAKKLKDQQRGSNPEKFPVSIN